MDLLEATMALPVEAATESLPSEPGAAPQPVEVAIPVAPESVHDDPVGASTEAAPAAENANSDDNDSRHTVSDDKDDHGADDEYKPTTAGDDDDEFRGDSSSESTVTKRKKDTSKKSAIPVDEHLVYGDEDSEPHMASEEEDLQDEIFILEQRIATLKTRERRRAKEGGMLSKNDQEKLEKTQKKLAELTRVRPDLACKTKQDATPDASDAKPNHAMSQTSSLTKSAKGSRKRKADGSGEAPGSVKKVKSNSQKIPTVKRRKMAPARKVLGAQDTLSDMFSGRTSIHDRAALDVALAKPIVANQLQEQLAQMRDRAFQYSDVDKTRIKADEKNLQIARGAFGPTWVSAVDGGWLIKNMKTTLFDHQLDAAGFMINRERSDDKPQGGILADEMGLGKTLTCLALIVKHRPGKGEKVLPTLVIVPSEAMAAQWLTEIERHCEDLFAQRYRRDEKLTTAILKRVAALVVTYSEVERCWNRHKPKEDEKTSQKQPSDQGFHLFNVNFHRIIYDECHVIKNHLSKTAKAIFNLKAQYHWLVSATPAPNNPDEFYPYLKILGLPHTENLKEFHKAYIYQEDDKEDDKEEETTSNLGTILGKIMLHRKTDSRVMGMRIFNDVPQTFSQKYVEKFSIEEQIIYDAVVEPLQVKLAEQERNLRIRFQGDNRSGSKESSDILIKQILKIHKLTAHPFMFESLLEKDISVEQIAKIRSNLKARGGKTSLIDQIGRMFSQFHDLKQDHDKSAEASGRSQHGGTFNMTPQFNLIMKRRVAEERYCPGADCRQHEIPLVALQLQCGHTYHEECWKLHSQRTKKDGKPAFCVRCKEEVRTEPSLINQSDIAGMQYVQDAAQPAKKLAKSKTKPRNRGDDFNGYQPREPREKLSTFLAENDNSHPLVPLTASTKTTMIKTIILGWLRDAPSDKIIVFTQWILMGRIIGRMLEDEGIKFLYYFGTGALTKNEKAKNLGTFKNDNEVKVLIMGLKCGGIGLDLHQANRVILVDPWWNLGGEDQAFARVLRKVQRKQTYFVKILIADSIDTRIECIQKTKSAMLDLLVKEDDPEKRNLVNAGKNLELAKMLIAPDEKNHELQEDNHELQEDNHDLSLQGLEA